MPMPKTPLRSQDWEHRLHVLSAWRKWGKISGCSEEDGATYRAVLDGCAVTIRALCYTLGIGCNFRNFSVSVSKDRLVALQESCNVGRDRLDLLEPEKKRCLLEVLYLGNRAVAHPQDGDLDHAVGRTEMTMAIDTVIGMINGRRDEFPEIDGVQKTFLKLTTLSGRG